MIRKNTISKIPDHPKYFKVTTSKGIYDFKLPLPTRFYIIEQIKDFIIGCRKGFHNIQTLEADYKVSIETILQNNLELYLSCMSAIIGLFWTDRSYILETDIVAPVNLYGLAIYTELDDRGWTTEDIEKVGSECFDRYLQFKESEPLEGDIKERLNFFARMQVSTI